MKHLQIGRDYDKLIQQDSSEYVM